MGPPLKLQNKQSKKWAEVAFEISYHTQILRQVLAKWVDYPFWLLEHLRLITLKALFG